MDEAKLLHPPPRGRTAARRPGAGGETLLDAGRRFLRCRDRSLAHAARHTPPRRYPSLVASPGPRDAAASEEARVEAELRAAVAALCGGLMKAAARLPSVPERPHAVTSPPAGDARPAEG